MLNICNNYAQEVQTEDVLVSPADLSLISSFDALNLSSNPSGKVIDPALVDWIHFKLHTVSMEKPADILTYSAFLQVFLNDKKRAQLGGPLIFRIEEFLNQAYKSLTGEWVQNRDFRLPRRVLKSGTHEEVLLHQAIFNQNQSGFLDSLKSLALDYIPRKRDFLYIILFLTFFYFETVRPIAFGILFGYLFSSFIEFIVHRYVGHSTKKDSSRLSRMGAVGREFLTFGVEHSSHHASVVKNHTSQFGGADFSAFDFEKRRDLFRKQIEGQVLVQKGLKVLNSVVSSNYGMSSSNQFKTNIFFLPLTLLGALVFMGVFDLLGITLGASFLVSFLALGQIWISTSVYFHKYLHLSEEDCQRNSGFFMGMFIKSRFSRFIARSHRAHHSTHGKINQNLNPAFDFVFGWKPASVSDLVDLIERKAIY